MWNLIRSVSTIFIVTFAVIAAIAEFIDEFINIRKMYDRITAFFKTHRSQIIRSLGSIFYVVSLQR
jgi:hypothetical protein